MALHVLFTEDGIPGWIGHDPRDGTEELPEKLLMGAKEVEVTVFFLAGHMRLASGEWVKRPVPPPPGEDEIEARRKAKLATARNIALADIDGMVQTARLRFVTPLAGQEAIYLAKEAEARIYVAMVPEPDTLDDFPYLAGEVGVTAPTAAQLAHIWLQRGALFRGLGARTENLRMTARKSVQVALSVEAVAEIMQELATGLDELG